MAAITFDGPGKCVFITYGPAEASTSVDVGDDLYSEWKRWAVLSDNLKYDKAFEVVGGQDKGGGKRVGSTFFLVNGWLLCPVTTQSESTLELIDELLPEVAGQPISDYSNMPSGHRISVERVVPTASETIESGVSGLTASESAELTAAASLLTTIIEGPHTVADILRIALAVKAGKTTIDETTGRTAFRDQADSKDRVSATVVDGERTAVTVDGTL